MNQEEALKWFADLFELPIASISPATARTEISAWDSLGVLKLIAGLDETFGIEINGDEVLTMQKVGDVLDLLRTKGKLLS
jgi:acyl carrier protein